MPNLFSPILADFSSHPRSVRSRPTFQAVSSHTLPVRADWPSRPAPDPPAPAHADLSRLRMPALTD